MPPASGADAAEPHEKRDDSFITESEHPGEVRFVLCWCCCLDDVENQKIRCQRLK